MIKNIFVSWFVVTAFLFMTVTAWVSLVKLGQKKISEDTSTKVELVFLAGIFILINVLSIFGVWYFDRISTRNDKVKVEQIEAMLEHLEMFG